MDSFFNDIASVGDSESIREGAKTLADFGRGLVYGAIEAPVNGVAQIANTAVEPLTGRSLKLDMTGLSDDMATGACNATAAEVGATIGGIIPFYAANKVAGKALGRSMSVAKTAEGLGLQTAKYSIGGSLAQGAVTGGVMGAVFTPTAEGENLFWDRAENGALGLAGGALFQGANDASRFGLSKYGQFGSASTSGFMLRELPVTVGTGALAGAGTGFANAHLTALMKEQRLASGEEVQHRMIMEGIMGGGFSAVHQVHSRLAQAAPLTEHQKSRLELVKLDESDPTWASMFKRSNPSADIARIKETMRRPGGDLAYQDVPVVGETGPIAPWVRNGVQWNRFMKGEPLTSGEVYALRSASNQRTMSAAFVENYKKKEWYANSHPFKKLDEVGVEPQYRNTGIEEHFLHDKLIPQLKRESPNHAGLVVEVADYKGLPAASHEQTIARFYRDKLELEELSMPHVVPPTAPAEAAGVRLHRLKEFCEKNSLPAPDDSSPARLLWKSFAPFDGLPVNNHEAASIQSSIYQSRYGIDPTDGFYTEQLIKIPTSQDLRGPMALETAPDVVSPVTVGDAGKVIWNRSMNAVDGEGFGVVNFTAVEEPQD